ISIAQAVNLARYLVSLPPNLLNPKTFVDRAQNLTWPSTVKIETWDHLRLKKENMNLHLAVGQGAEHPSRLLKIQYRPAKAQSKKPIAFVGKGVTFDTGGLDLKPSSAMRLMKKDMGGAATVLALAYWVAESQYPLPCDFYVGLAENSVGEKSFRPSDVYTARNGKTVEIDNTDAEGRLVLADVLDVAVTSAADPDVVIDVATLTGAIKVALGVDIAGLFCNDEGLSAELQKAGRHSGDPNWPMPMPDKMMSSLASSFADFKNSGDGFGGAITAALFLKQFVRNKKWAHLDIYAWNDKSQGALTSVGGKRQGVQCLIHYLQAQIK
ncbi:MAG: leucyl aminopeptidase family protein, partial [Pseudobdellovibrionaceae bacterium]